MADTLDSMLEPGERVIYRRLWRLLPRRWSLGLGTLLMFVGLGLMVHTGFITVRSALGFLLFIFVPVTVVTRAAWWEQALEMVVTERRILSITDLARPLFQEVRLDRIAAVAIARHSVLITTRDDEEIRLGHPDHATELGRAIAQGAGLAPPDPPRKAEAYAERAMFLAGLAMYFGVLLVAGTIIDAGHGLPATVSFLIALLTAAVVAYLLGELLFLALLRPFFTWAEMHAWIARTDLLPAGPGSRQKNEVRRSYLLRFVDLLYGRPKDGRSEGTAEQG